MKLIAYTIKGIEQFVANEILEKFNGAVIDKIGDKYVIFSIDDNYMAQNNRLFHLTTADDLGLLVKEINKPKKISTDELIKEITDIDYLKYKDIIQNIRRSDRFFSFTFSIVKLKINKEHLVNGLKIFFKSKYMWQYSDLDHTNFDIRIFLNRKEAFISVRLLREPLYHRSYKGVSTLGALKPSIASTLIRLATKDFMSLPDKIYIVDNFCGSGTILCEALAAGFRIAGGDISQNSVKISKQNLSFLTHDKDTIKYIRVLDATSSGWEDNQFDIAVSNLPWNKQIEVTKITELYIKTLAEYKRVLKPNANLVLLVHKPQILVKYAKKYFPNHTIESIKTSFKGQNPTIVVIKSKL